MISEVLLSIVLIFHLRILENLNQILLGTQFFKWGATPLNFRPPLIFLDILDLIII
jgi:hypothetical protein